MQDITRVLKHWEIIVYEGDLAVLPGDDSFTDLFSFIHCSLYSYCTYSFYPKVKESENVI